MTGSVIGTLRDAIGQALHLDPDGVRPETPLADLGFDAGTLALLEDGVRARLGIGVEPIALLRARTVRDMADHLAARLPPSAAAGTTDLLATVRATAGEALEGGAGELDPDEPFGHLGFDSITLKRFAALLTERLNTPVDAVLLFSHPTLRALAAHLARGNPPRVPVASPAGRGVDRGGTHDVAVVGMACRLPGADGPDAFWRNQAAMKNCIAEVPRQRWDWARLLGDPLREAGRTDVRWGGFIEGVDRFSPDFFGRSTYEAELMDPQHRLFLQAAWETVWDAGHDPRRMAGRAVGVFAGVQFGDYEKLLASAGALSGQVCTGNAHAMLANRVSFLLDIRGPSEAIDTACSSSMVAIHRAVRAIRQGECDAAIAGGVNLMLVPDLFIMGRQLGILSPRGQCRTFDAGADGYVRGEGVGALLLKPLDAALRDSDHVYGVIRGTAVNHGGRAASLTAPSSRA